MKLKNFLTEFIALALIFSTTLFFNQKVLAAIAIKTEKTAENFETVPLLSSATLEIEAQKSSLLPVSHGLRKKAVFGLVPVRVYVLQLLAAKADKLVKTDESILKSLKEAGPLLLEITFLRDLPGSRISEAFKDGLESNGLKVKNLSPELNQVLKEIADIQEFKKNDSFSIAVTWAEKNATVYLQQSGSQLKTISGSADFAEQFLSIWFGKPSDSLLKELKKSLIK